MADKSEFPKLQAGSLRKGFTIIFEGKVRRVLSVDKRKTTINIEFYDHYSCTVLNDKIVEVIVKNRKEKVRNGKRKRTYAKSANRR